MRALARLLVPSALLVVSACSSDPAPGADDDDVGTSSSGTVGSGSSGGGGSSSSGGGASSSGGSSGGSTSSSGGSSGGSSSGGPVDPVHEDGIQNAGETDVDCGGGEAPVCEPDQDCELGPRDCSSQVCVDAVCTEPNDEDGVKNGDETGVDCGGPTSLKLCPPSQGCDLPADCQQGVCTANVCAAPIVGDGVKNGDETGVDCGGPVANPRCNPGFGCGAPGDCAEGVCTTQLCAEPTDADGVKNQGEMGVDCGGPHTVKTCAAGTACGEDLDCTSTACDHTGVCAVYPSCKNHFGGDTCGSGETFDAVGVRDHHSCCDTAPVTSAGGVKLEKYNITAGRMRAFVEATAGNIKKWVDEHPPAGWVADWSNYLPTGLNTPVKQVQTTVRNLGVYGQLGPEFVYDQAGEFGCWSGANATGAPTYWIPTADRVAQNPNDVGSLYPQDLLDQKPLNCVNVLMVAAFCAWDGGRLPTIGELDAAWNGAGTRTYPWGTETPGGYPSGYPSAANLSPAGSDPLRANFRHNYPQDSTKWAALATFWNVAGFVGNDQAWYIAPPGRFPAGVGPYGHEDLGGAVFNVTKTFTGSTTETLGMISRWSRSGSWENAHQIPYPTHASPVLRKYWAQGGRCVKN